jgi:hypothetical protein
MSFSSVRGPAIAATLCAALVLCLRPLPAGASPSSRLEGSPVLGRVRPAVAQGLASALEQATPAEVAALALPEARAALLAAAGAAGVPAAEQERLVADIVAESQEIAAAGTAWTEPVYEVGSFTLSLSQARWAAGPREGRDRIAVAERLRRIANEQGGWREDDFVALVPLVVTLSESSQAGSLLARLRDALLLAGSAQ